MKCRGKRDTTWNIPRFPCYISCYSKLWVNFGTGQHGWWEQKPFCPLVLQSGREKKTNNHPRTIWSVVNSQTFLVKEKFPSSATFLISNLKTRRMDLDRSAKLPEQKVPQKGRHYFVFSSCIKEITIGNVCFQKSGLHTVEVLLSRWFFGKFTSFSAKWQRISLSNWICATFQERLAFRSDVFLTIQFVFTF